MSTTAEFVLLTLVHTHLDRRISTLVFTPYEALYATLSPTIYHQSSVRHAITELAQLNLIEKISREGKKYVSLTPAGIAFGQSRWAHITKVRTIDTSVWFLAFFDIPESKRSLRDELRQTLVKLGFKQWQRSLYLLPKGVHSETKIVNSLSKTPWKEHTFVVTVNSFVLGIGGDELYTSLWEQEEAWSVELITESTLKSRDQLIKRAANVSQKNAAFTKLQENLGLLYQQIESKSGIPFTDKTPSQTLSLFHLICETLQTTSI